ncbi:MAG: Fur family transcriptional regulator [Candidatus Kariarchaeaceae archaeon]|jgi:Fur family peroxide stress response transcriptional regulator
MDQSDKELVSLLHQKGLKVTPQRLAIFRYLANNESHPSADIIFADIKKELPTVSQGTVYKTLSMLTDIGVVSELKLGNGHSRYDSNTTVHINIICPNCNKITDYQPKEIISFWENITEDIGGEITGQRFDIYKKCNKCNA